MTTVQLPFNQCLINWYGFVGKTYNKHAEQKARVANLPYRWYRYKPAITPALNGNRIVLIQIEYRYIVPCLMAVYIAQHIFI